MTRSPRIVDLVFAREPPGRQKRWGFGVAIVLVLYGGVFAFVSRLGSAQGPPGAERAARAHEAIALERATSLRFLSPPALSPTKTSHTAAPRTAHATRVPRARPVPSVQAGQLAGASPEPVDFPGSVLIVGAGASYAGGTTTGTGTSQRPALGDAAHGETNTPALPIRSRARLVSLAQAAWNCPWPAEADAQQVDEQTVILRARVRADGRADDVDVVTDPGFGFGAAARLCALATRFDPARDATGQPIAALSPPIRVHFFR